MKKTLLSVMAIVAMGTVQAQEIEFGVKAGVNFATYGGDDAESEGSEAKSVTGFHIGAVAEFGISETFAIQPEIVYSQQGANREYETGEETEQNLSYLNVPIALKYYVTEGLSIQAGPQVGFLLSAKGDTFDMVNGGILEDVDNKDAFETVDFGVFGGLGYDLPMGVFFQARYYVGLTSIQKEFPGIADGEEIDVKNNVFSLSVGYKF